MFWPLWIFWWPLSLAEFFEIFDSRFRNLLFWGLAITTFYADVFLVRLVGKFILPLIETQVIVTLLRWGWIILAFTAQYIVELIWLVEIVTSWSRGKNWFNNCVQLWLFIRLISYTEDWTGLYSFLDAEPVVFLSYYVVKFVMLSGFTAYIDLKEGDKATPDYLVQGKKPIEFWRFLLQEYNQGFKNLMRAKLRNKDD